MNSIFSQATARLARWQSSFVGDRSRIISGGRKGLLWALLPMLFNCPLIALEANPDVPANPGLVRKAVESPIKYAGVLYRSGNRRDPFLNPLLLSKKSRRMMKKSPGGSLLRELPAHTSPRQPFRELPPATM